MPGHAGRRTSARASGSLVPYQVTTLNAVRSPSVVRASDVGDEPVGGSGRVGQDELVLLPVQPRIDVHDALDARHARVRGDPPRVVVEKPDVCLGR